MDSDSYSLLAALKKDAFLRLQDGKFQKFDQKFFKKIFLIVCDAKFNALFNDVYY